MSARDYNGRLITWDVGGPLRDSSESMGHALKMAAAENGYILTLNNRLMWQLWTIKGPKFDRKGGDYEAWFKAAHAIEVAAMNKKSWSSNELCSYLFDSEDPVGAVEDVVSKYGVDESVHEPIGKKAIELFGSDPVTMSKNRVNDGSMAAVKFLYKDGNLMGIVSSAPSPESVTDWIDEAIRTPLTEKLEIPEDAVLFHPELIHYGKISKEQQLEQSVMTAGKILGYKPTESWYLADANDDIIETGKANQELLKKDMKPINLAMVKNGMGFPKMWEKAWKQAGFEPGNDYFEFESSLDFADYLTKT